MVAEGLLPRPAQVAVERVEQDRQDALPQPPLDLRPVAIEQAQPEGEEVVGDPVDAAAGAARILGHRHHALDQAQGDEALQRAPGVGPHRLLDLVELGAAGGDRVESLAGQLAPLPLRGQHQLALGEELAAGGAGEAGEVGAEARGLVPPLQVEGHAADQPPDEGTLRGAEGGSISAASWGRNGCSGSARSSRP